MGTEEVSRQVGIPGSWQSPVKHRSPRIVDFVRDEAFGLRKPSEGFWMRPVDKAHGYGALELASSEDEG